MYKVVDEVVTEDFLCWVIENSYKLNIEQQKEVKEFISTSFSRRVAQVSTIDLTSTVQDDDDDDDDGGGSIQGKNVTKVTSKGPSFDPFEPSSSRTSARVHASDDLSLLGPGQFSESTSISGSGFTSTFTQIHTADDLSLLGPGQMPQTLDRGTSLRKSTAKARPLLKLSSHDQSSGISQDITLSSSPSHVLTRNFGKFRSSPLGDKGKLNGSHPARSHTHRLQLASTKSGTSKKPARAVSPLEIIGDLGHDMISSGPSLGTSPVPR